MLQTPRRVSKASYDSQPIVPGETGAKAPPALPSVSGEILIDQGTFDIANPTGDSSQAIRTDGQQISGQLTGGRVRPTATGGGGAAESLLMSTAPIVNSAGVEDGAIVFSSTSSTSDTAVPDASAATARREGGQGGGPGNGGGGGGGDGAPGLAFRDEVLPWIDDGSGSEDDEDDDDEVVDESALYGDSTIDTGVTSGADPAAWDPIGINNRP